MQGTKLNYFRISLLLLIGFFLISCSMARKIARSFVSNKEERSVLIFFPKKLFKSNLETYLIIQEDSLQSINEDSILIAKSVFLKHIDDSLFISKCKQSMVKELNALGITVYEYEQIDKFMALNDSSYVLNLAQMQLEESTQKEEIEDDDYEIVKIINIETISLNTWFELSRNNVPDEKFPILYSSYIISDDLENPYSNAIIGTWWDNGGLYNPRRMNAMNIADVYDLAEFAGKNLAINFYDYLLNIYVQDHLPKDKTPKYYFHYYRKWKHIHSIYYDSFEEMDP